MKQKVFYWTGWLSVIVPIISIILMLINFSTMDRVSIGLKDGETPRVGIFTSLPFVFLFGQCFVQYLVLRWYAIKVANYRLIDLISALMVVTMILGWLGVPKIEMVDDSVHFSIVTRLLYCFLYVAIGVVILGIKNSLFSMKKYIGISSVLVGCCYLFNLYFLASAPFLVIYIALTIFFFRAAKAFSPKADSIDIVEPAHSGSEKKVYSVPASSICGAERVRQRAFYWVGWVGAAFLIMALLVVVLTRLMVSSNDFADELSPFNLRILSYLWVAYIIFQYLVLRWYIVRVLKLKLFDIASVIYIGTTITGLFGLWDMLAADGQPYIILIQRMLFGFQYLAVGVFILSVENDLFGMRTTMGVSEILSGLAYWFKLEGLSLIPLLVFCLAVCIFSFRAAKAFKLAAEQSTCMEASLTGGL